jgi:2-keto-3-deoxy-L-rhamnonate aldolase RhmA
MRPNVFREKLNAGKPTISTHIHTVWPAVVEVIGHTGLYDYVEFVAEYGSFDLHDLDNLCRASELYGMGSMIKIDQSHQRFLAQRGIGAGFGSVLFTDCRSADDVRECVRIARPDTPQDKGLYGVAVRRSTYMGGSGTPEYVQALRDTVVAIMIEKKGAVDELLAVGDLLVDPRDRCGCALGSSSDPVPTLRLLSCRRRHSRIVTRPEGDRPSIAVDKQGEPRRRYARAARRSQHTRN